MKPTNRALRRRPDPFAGDDILARLRSSRKYLPCKLLYDARGADLFEQICAVDDYYPYRSELALLEQHLPAIAAVVGPAARVIEPGSGAGIKTRMLLTALERPATYVPIDVSSEQLASTASALHAAFPDLAVLPIAADYTQDLVLPPVGHAGRSLVFFPGSTIGNFEPEDAARFLARFATLAGPDASLVLGADSNHDTDELLRAYDDSQGVTAAFDLNVLAHLNRTHGATFDLGAFMHRAVWNATYSRVEMHLVSRRRQVVTVLGEAIQLERGEPIITEYCYKHSPEVIAGLLENAGWRVRQSFTDPRGRMRLWLGDREDAAART